MDERLNVVILTKKTLDFWLLISNVKPTKKSREILKNEVTKASAIQRFLVQYRSDFLARFAIECALGECTVWWPTTSALVSDEQRMAIFKATSADLHVN